MASSLRAFSFAQATPSSFIHGVKLPYLACHHKPCDIHLLATHTAVLKTKVQVATINDASPIPAPPKTSLARRFAHLDDLAQEISSSEDVSSTLQPWLNKLTIQEWYALLMEDTNRNWHFAWEMFSVLKENSSLLDPLPPEHEESQIEGDGAETPTDNAPELAQGDVVAQEGTHSDSEPESVQGEATADHAPLKRSKKPLTRLKIYTNIVRVLARHERDEEVKEVMVQMQEAGLKPNIDFYSKLLDSVLICQRIDKANEILSQMEESGIKPDNFILEKLAYAYLREENPDLGKAMEILKELVKGGGPTSKGVFSNLVTAYWAANDPDGIEEVFEAMQTAGHTPDLKVVFKLMQLHARRGNHERVLELVEMVSKFELQPNCGVFDCLLLAYCKAGLVEKAKETFAKYQSVLGLQPSVVAHNMLVDVLGKQGLHEEALQAFEDIRKARRIPTAVSYSSIISTLVKAGNFQTVDQLYRRMLKEKVRPNLHTYVMLIHSFNKRNQTRNGHLIYNAMKSSRVPMTEVENWAVLRLYVEGNWYTAAAATLKQLEEKGAPLDAASHGSLIRSFGILEPHALTPLAKAIQESDYEVCKLLSSLFLDANNLKTESEFLDILGPFLEKWNILDDVDAKAQIYTAFLDCLWKKNLKARCKWLLGLAREAYADYTRPQWSEGEWTLDVRGCSIGGGKVAVIDWLSSMDEALSGNVTDDMKVIIITGDELTPHVIQDNRLLKGALITMLEELSSPFAESEEDSTKLQASAAQVLKWVSDGSVKDTLSLADSC